MRRAVLILLMLLLLVGCVPTPAAVPAEPLALDYHGVMLSVGMSADEAIAALGDDYTLAESESCAGVGTDRLYTYPSMRLYVFAPAKGAATVTSACYTDDGASTGDVRIGCDAETVTATFGTPDETRENTLIYRRSGATLTLSLREGRVTAIVLSED